METLRYVVLANGLLAVVSSTFYVLLRRETFFGANRLALWLGLTASLLLPLLELPDWRPQPVRAVMQRTARVIVPKLLPGPPALQPEVTITFPNGRTYPAFSPKLVAAGWSWQRGLFGLYVAVLLALLVRFGIRLRSLLRLIGQSAQEPYDDFTLVKNETVTSPFSFFGWVVLNPGHHAPDELEQILWHERVHVRAWHSLDMVAAELVSIIFWLNPAAYLFRQLVHQTLEFSADRAVLAEGIDAQLYQYNLVKVSLSAGQSSISNHFSKSQLKSRIVMLNKPKSPRTTWLKYPVLCITALMVATTFARPQVKALKKYVPAPVAEAISAVAQAVETPIKLAPPVENPTGSKMVKSVKKSVSDYKEQETQPALEAELITDSSKKDSARISPSRFITYEGDYLYWVVTPKTTFDDFAVMKQEIAKYGHMVQLNEIKYDPLYTYIDKISFSIVRSSGGRTRCDELEDDNKPIPSISGYLGIGPKARSSGTGRLDYFKSDYYIPQILKKVAADDEAAIAEFIHDRRMEYLVQAGYSKYASLGSGSRTFTKDYFKKPGSRSSGITIQPDGSLLVNEELGSIKIFINNEPATPEAVRMWTSKQLYAVVAKEQYNPAKKESFTSALLIYANEDN